MFNFANKAVSQAYKDRFFKYLSESYPVNNSQEQIMCLRLKVQASY